MDWHLDVYQAKQYIDEAITLYNIGIENEILILTPIIMKEYFKNPLIEKFTVTIDNREILDFIPKELNINAHIYVYMYIQRDIGNHIVFLK